MRAFFTCDFFLYAMAYEVLKLQVRYLETEIDSQHVLRMVVLRFFDIERGVVKTWRVLDPSFDARLGSRMIRRYLSGSKDNGRKWSLMFSIWQGDTQWV